MSAKRPFIETEYTMGACDPGSCDKFCGGGDGDTTPRQPVDAMDSLVASELNQLSLEEREAVFEEIHGVNQVEEESPEVIASFVEQLKQQIKKIRGKSAYDKALFLCPSYVDDPKFCLMFLRADNFNVRLAAERMVSHFKHKLEIFGIEKLAKAITLEDLDVDAMDAISTGSIQFLPKKDRSGRTVCIIFNRLIEYKTINNQRGAMWYMLMSKLEDDEDAQKKGLVVLRYSVEDDSSFNLEFSMKTTHVGRALPFRASAYHFCYDNEKLRSVFGALQMLMGTSVRIRFRTHYGSRLEVLYGLLSYGITKEGLPLHDSGEVHCIYLTNYLEERRSMEEARKAKIGDKIMFPLKNDVLLGRGRPFQEFPGNVQLAKIIDDYREAYQAGKKLDKTAISTKSLKLVKDSNGRFLKKEDNIKGFWVDVSDEVAREKVSHGFRTKPRKNAAARQREPDTRSTDGSTGTFSSNGNNKRPKTVHVPSSIFAWNWGVP